MSNYLNSKEWVPLNNLTLEDKALEAVYSETNTLVTAGPGSGKTELLSQKVDYLLTTNKCTYPKKILAISFKKDSASNLRQRVIDRRPPEYASRFSSLTYDSFFKMLLDQFRNALKISIRPHDNYEINNLDTFRHALNIYGNGYLKDNQLINRIDTIFANKSLDKLGNKEYKLLSLLLKGDSNHPPSLTFKLISRLVYYILENKHVLRSIQETYSYVFLDEFQDTTSIQYELLKTMFLHSKSKMIAVGDSKQRIMLWAGARKTIFKDFLDDFQARKIELEMNYRSAPKLVEFQRKMQIFLNESTVDIQSSNQWEDTDGEIDIIFSGNEEQEAHYIANNIRENIENGINPSEICILAKQKPHNYTHLISRTLNEFGIKSRVENDYQDMLKEPFVLIIISYIKFSFDKKDSDSRKVILDFQFFEKYYNSSLYNKDYLKDLEELDEMTKKFKNKMNNVNSLEDAKDAFQFLIESINKETLIATSPAYAQGLYFEKEYDKFLKLLYNLHRETKNWTDTVHSFLGKDTVPIMTVHKSKGLEYEVVYFIGLEDGAFWNFSNDKEEDKRSFFVALSRAKEKIIFTYTEDRTLTYSRKQTRYKITEFYDLLLDSNLVNVITLK